LWARPEAESAAFTATGLSTAREATVVPQKVQLQSGLVRIVIHPTLLPLKFPLQLAQIKSKLFAALPL